jgi:hypothetical protein
MHQNQSWKFTLVDPAKLYHAEDTVQTSKVNIVSSYISNEIILVLFVTNSINHKANQ